jgi:hypothetical protein
MLPKFYPTYTRKPTNILGNLDLFFDPVSFGLVVHNEFIEVNVEGENEWLQ